MVAVIVIVKLLFGDCAGDLWQCEIPYSSLFLIKPELDYWSKDIYPVFLLFSLLVSIDIYLQIYIFIYLYKYMPISFRKSIESLMQKVVLYIM